MATTNTSEADDLELVKRATSGDASSVSQLFGRYRERLKRMVRLRLDPRVQGRVDPSDVVQEALLAACKKLPDYLSDSRLPFYLWLRLETGQNLALVHRKHLGVQARDAGREVSLYRGALPEASSAALAAQLMGNLTTPSRAAIKAERRLQVQEALNRMDPIDREVLTLRHFEQLSNAETATVLGIKENTACNRYVRALERLRSVLKSVPGMEGA
jgi:RNA polymerase sigma-70 factor (ECF subfamily)